MREKDIPQISYEMIQEITNPTYFNRSESYYKSRMVKKGWIIEAGINILKFNPKEISGFHDFVKNLSII